MTEATRIESPEMRQALAQQAQADGFLELPDFVETALYHPYLGYYRKESQRVGRSRETDFYTSSSFREAFAAIITEASCALLQKAGYDPAESIWVEIGAEPGAALLSDTTVPFQPCQIRCIGEPLSLPTSRPIVVFSNELFDAQPFRQIRFLQGRWQEMGLTLHGDSLSFSPRPELSAEASAYLDRLPTEKSEGYTIDLPTGSRSIAQALLSQNWKGAFIAFDYGKTWQSLSEETPQGTARAYFQHTQNPRFLEKPGQQDITHHICWDDLQDELQQNDFSEITLEAQESFIVKRAPAFMAKAFDPSRSPLDPLRGMLKQLMLPNFMGQKFQALTAIRP